MSNPIMAAENALMAAYKALRRLSADRPAADTKRLATLLALVTEAGEMAGITAPVAPCQVCAEATAEVRRLQTEVDALAKERDAQEKVIIGVEKLLPKHRDDNTEPHVVLRKMLEDCERRAATAERDLVIERARRAQAERHASDLAEGLPRSRLVPLGPPTDPEAIESAHLAAGADDCASHSRPPERALRPVRGRGKRMRDAVPDVPREEGEGAPV